MVKLQIVKGVEDSERTTGKRRVCTVACCVDNAYGMCSSQYSSKVCSEPCAKFVQVTSSCTSRCSACGCLAG